MSSIRNGNTLYLTNTSDTFTIANLKVSHIIITSTGSAGTAVLSDVSSSSNTKLSLVVAANASQEFRFADQPILFPMGVQVVSISNCVLTLVYSVQGS